MKNLSFRHFLFLYLLSRFKGDRTIKSVFHLLNGKRSSQTIQDIKWYGLTEFFSMLPTWKVSVFEQETKWMENHLFTINSDNKAHVTKKGNIVVENYFNNYDWPPQMNGWKYGHTAAIFWKRLALLVQCLSFSLEGNRSYVPVFDDRDIQQWLKQRWPRNRTAKKEMAFHLYNELFILLDRLPEKDAFLFTHRLSGHQHTGKTIQQLASLMNQDPDESYFRFQSTLHYLLANAHQTTYIKDTAGGLLQKHVLTDTAKKTNMYLQKGLTIQEIAAIRGLKSSTIEDHIVELASEGADFTIDCYVSTHLQRYITDTVQRLRTFRLKLIKEALEYENIHADYFSIRVTLAYFGGIHENA
ncbi:helix-turn-helix domain-containing protein [Alteribacillus sp. YIM 98480]|uniref:helix-turn-helix domain-containing protein n=1 Tax=Alteribacillus sp. YIM 98480 TaxID=2606599 RepID=UPI00131C3CFD|nr:helix-turn-helix domain-containing protein [Alteribacillus sp. YIM 98480]